METDKELEQQEEFTIGYLTEDDKKDLVFQWLARRWNEESKE